MIIFDVVILLPYLLCCLPETLPPSKRQSMQWRSAAPGLGMSCSSLIKIALNKVEHGRSSRYFGQSAAQNASKKALLGLFLQGNELFMQLSCLATSLMI